MLGEIRSGTESKLEVHELNQAEQIPEITSRIGVAVEVEDIFLRLLPVPERVKINGIDAQLFQVQKNFRPSIARDAVVKECGAVHEERFAIDPIFGKSIDHAELIVG